MAVVTNTSLSSEPNIEEALRLARTCMDVWNSQDRYSLQEPDDVRVARALLAEHERAEAWHRTAISDYHAWRERAEAAERERDWERSRADSLDIQTNELAKKWMAAEQRVKELEAVLREGGCQFYIGGDVGACQEQGETNMCAACAVLSEPTEGE